MTKKNATILAYLFIPNQLYMFRAVFAHQQEHSNVFTASDIVHRYCRWLVSWMRWNVISYIASSVTVDELLACIQKISLISCFFPISNLILLIPKFSVYFALPKIFTSYSNKLY